jgi:Glycosyltransferase
MKILLHDYSGHPFQVQLSRELSRRGHQVLHLYSESFQTPKGHIKLLEDDPAGFMVKGISLSEPFAKYSYIKRRKQETEVGRKVAETITEFSPDVVISSNAPLDAQKLIVRTSKRERAKFIFWLQDIYSIAIERYLAAKLPILGNLIGAYYSRLEAKMLQMSDCIVAISDDFIPELSKLGVKKENIEVIPNWAPIEDIPVMEKNNQWASAHNLDDKFCFLYSGTIGLKHDPGLLLDLALEFQVFENVMVVVVSEGPGADWLKEQSRRKDVNNLLVFDYQPFEVLPQVLATGDVLVSILEPEAGVFSVPSKVLTYLCAERPLLLAVPIENLAARMVNESQAGMAVDPSNRRAFLDAAVSLFNDEKKRYTYGRNARRYAEEHFNITYIAERFENLF